MHFNTNRSRIFIATIFSLAANIFMVANVHADFDLAMSYYENKEFEVAYREFLEAASFGDHQAQYNLGVMYVRGEHVAKDLKYAYAWLSLSEQGNANLDASAAKKIYAHLDDQQKLEADKIFSELNSKYSDESIQRSLMPIFVGASESTKQFQPIKRVAPIYPQVNLRLGLYGVVDVFYSIDKDGTTRDFLVYYSTNMAFEKAAIEGLRQWQFEPLMVKGKPHIVNGLKRRFMFSLAGNEFDTKKIEGMVSDMKNIAEKGDAAAKLDYAYLLDVLPSYASGYMAKDNPNEWYIKAANSGSPIASYLLGRNILYGNMCSMDTHKSLGWLTKAAGENLTNAQYVLAIEAFSGALFEKNDTKGLYWLRKAAKVNSMAQLRLAWILTTHPDEKIRNLNEAEANLAKVDEKHYYDKQTLFQVHAAIAAEKGDFKRALKWEAKAREDAEELKLPLNYIDERIASYKAKKPWREDI